MRFRVKTDWWIHLIIAVLIIELILTVIDLRGTNELLMGMFIAVTAIILVLFIIPFYFSSYYHLHENYLQLRLGLISEICIPYKAIRRLAPSKKVMISYAMSYDRLELVYEGMDKNKYTVLVSPKNKEEFIKEIQKRNPDIDTNCQLSKKAAESQV